MAYVAGVDGCANGWFAVFCESHTRKCCAERFDRISDILTSCQKPCIVAVDIPIGLLDAAEGGGRHCDREVRALLGRPRCCSVFSAPVRQALRHASSYRAAHLANRRSSPVSVGISKQCHSLFPKIIEVDEMVGSAFGSQIFEVHPELCFYQINKCRPMQHGKRARNAAGLEERTEVLRRTQFAGFLDSVSKYRSSEVGRDDILDAMAACWTALRIASGEALSVGDALARIWR